MTMIEDLDEMLDPIITAMRPAFRTKLLGHLARVYISGSQELTSWGTTKAGLDIVYEGPPIRGAINYAKDRGSTMITGMDEQTKKQMANIISKGIEDKRGIDGIMRDILHGDFQDMSRSRAEMISRNETANALSTAAIDRMRDIGVEGKEWIVANPCDACAANGDVGVIPVDEYFPEPDVWGNPVLAPTLHPG